MKQAKIEIRTSFSLDKKDAEIIRELAKVWNCSLGCVVEKLFSNYIQQQVQKIASSYRPVLYRPRKCADNSSEQVRLYISLPPHHYARFLDARNAFKISLSYLLTKAVSEYSQGREMHSYVIHAHISEQICENGVVKLTSYWGYPEKYLRE